MGQKKGQTGNPKGRPKGVPNKVTGTVKEWIQQVIDGNRKRFEKDLLAYIIHSGFISGYQNRYGDNLKPPTNVYHRMTA